MQQREQMLRAEMCGPSLSISQQTSETGKQILLVLMQLQVRHNALEVWRHCLVQLVQLADASLANPLLHTSTLVENRVSETQLR